MCEELKRLKALAPGASVSRESALRPPAPLKASTRAPSVRCFEVTAGLLVSACSNAGGEKGEGGRRLGRRNAFVRAGGVVSFSLRGTVVKPIIKWRIDEKENENIK